MYEPALVASRCQPGFASRENKGTMWLEISPAINIDTPVSGVDPGEHTPTIEIAPRCLFRDQDCLEGGNLPPKIICAVGSRLEKPQRIRSWYINSASSRVFPYSSLSI